MEKTLFMKFFGREVPVLKVIDFLIDNETFDYSKTDIAEGAGISWSSLFNIWNTLEKNNIVTKTREVGKAKMYKLNKKNPIVKKLMELDKTLSDLYAEEATEKVIV